MKILLINITYRRGSTGKIIYDSKIYYESLGHDVYVAYAFNSVEQEKKVYQLCNSLERHVSSLLSKLGLNQFRACYFATNKLIRLIEKINPDIVHIHCLNSFSFNLFKLLDYLSKNNMNTVITHHAEFYYTGSCSHAFECDNWRLNQCKNCPRPKQATFNRIFPSPHRNWLVMYEAFNRFDKNKLCFTCVSPWVLERAHTAPIINKYEQVLVLNGIDTQIFRRNPTIKKPAPLNNRRISDQIVLHVTAVFNTSDYVKGGVYVVELAKKNPEITFLVVANFNKIECDLPSNIVMIGRLTEQIELASYYVHSNVTLITSERETFSMVVAESLCCGTPVCGFFAGGPESIAIPDYSQFCAYGDINALNASLHKVLSTNYDREIISKEAKIRYSSKTMALNYLSLYNNILGIV